MNKEIIDKTIAALRHNHFEAFFAHNTAEASAIFFRDIFPGLQVETVSWGDSETMKATGVLNELQKNPELSVIDSFAPGMSRKQKIYWRRQALLTDLFLTGSNALTQKGQLVNLDMIGNRVGGITFGPKHVVLFIGINKITALGKFNDLRQLCVDLGAGHAQNGAIEVDILAARHLGVETGADFQHRGHAAVQVNIAGGGGCDVGQQL